MKQKIVIIVLLIGIAVFGFLIVQKQKASQPIYSLSGIVAAVSNDMITINTFERPSRKIELKLNRKTEIVKPSNQNNQLVYQAIPLSEIKAESEKNFASEITVYSHDNPANTQQLGVYRVELTKEGKIIQ